MTYNEYLGEVRKRYLHRASLYPHGAGLCYANSWVNSKEATSNSKYAARLSDAIDKALGCSTWLDSLWALNGTHGVRPRPRDTKRKHQQRIIAARLNFLEAQKER